LKPTKSIRHGQEHAEFAPEETFQSRIGQILASEDELIPSSGFAASVMERVREEAAAPPPIPFPWARALPGILVTAGALGWGTYKLIHLGPAALGLPGFASQALSSFTLAPAHLSPAAVASVESAGWVALALGASLVSWLFSRRLAGRGGLL
jgi:hypothetical protein